ncbi:hypothetical protein GCM10027431_15280 [Lysobacter rhizosphaerae]
MDLATHERRLLALVRDNRPLEANDDPYFKRVACSPYLQEARRNVFLWRVYVLERTCPLTFVLLRQRGLLADAVSGFIARHNISPFRETQAPAFLAALATHRDGLVALVAQFERALLLVRDGDARTHAFDWPVEPTPVLHRLARGEAIGEPTPGAYRITISGELPKRFEIRALA